MAQTSMKLRKSIDSTSRVIIGNFDKDITATPFFMKELGIVPIGIARDESNILKIDDNKTPYRYLDNQKAWQSRVELMYHEYVPNMDE